MTFDEVLEYAGPSVRKVCRGRSRPVVGLEYDDLYQEALLVIHALLAGAAAKISNPIHVTALAVRSVANRLSDIATRVYAARRSPARVESSSPEYVHANSTEPSIDVHEEILSRLETPLEAAIYADLLTPDEESGATVSPTISLATLRKRHPDCSHAEVRLTTKRVKEVVLAVCSGA